VGFEGWHGRAAGGTGRAKLSRKQKAAKEDPGGWHGRVTGGTGRAKLLTWENIFLSSNLRIFNPNQLQIPFFCSKTQSLEYLFLKLNNLQLK